MNGPTRREIALVLAGPTFLAGASWVISHGWWLLTCAAVAVLLIVFLRLTARPVRPREVMRVDLPRPRTLPRSDGSGHGPVQARRSTRPRARASTTH